MKLQLLGQRYISGCSASLAYVCARFDPPHILALIYLDHKKNEKIGREAPEIFGHFLIGKHEK